MVVGIGNSGSEIASEMAEAGIEVTVSIRSGANVIPRSIAGIPTQYFGWVMSCVPTPAQRRIVGGMGADWRLAETRAGPTTEKADEG